MQITSLSHLFCHATSAGILSHQNLLHQMVARWLVVVSAALHEVRGLHIHKHRLLFKAVEQHSNQCDPVCSQTRRGWRQCTKLYFIEFLLGGCNNALESVFFLAQQTQILK